MFALPSRRSAALLLAAAPALACGGAAPPPSQPENAATDVSIGDIAASQGGLQAFGATSSETGPGSLRANLVDKDSRVKLDGVLGEWPARSPARVEVKGTAGDNAFAGAVQYDDRALYVGGEVTEASFFRTARFAEGEDHASLILAFPAGAGRLTAYEVGLFAGKPGETTGEVRFVGTRRGAVPGARIIEAPNPKGYTFEAVIPWSAFAEARTVRVGLRAALRYYVSDGSPSPRAVLATAQGDASSPSSLPSLLLEAEQSIVDGLLVPKGLGGEAPKVDLLADVAGSPMKERVAVWGSFLTISGPGYRGGKEFFFKDLGGELVSLEAKDVTGRGKDDLVLRRRVKVEGSTRDWLEVLSVMAGDEPAPVFSHEVSIERDGKKVTNTAKVGARSIDVSIDAATGWDASSYKEPQVDGVEPLLLPWGATRAETFRFSGGRFVRSHEEKQTPAPGAAAAQRVSIRPPEPQTPEVVQTDPSRQPAGDLSAQLFAQYKRDHGVASSASPKADLAVDLTGDGRPERVVVIGKDIVVFGPGFMGGTQYAYLTLSQFDAPSDIADVTTRDLTGDGGAEIIVRGARHVAAPGGGGTVQVDALFVYQVGASGLTRLFGIETGRSQGKRRVQGLVQFVPGAGGKGFDIDVRPGRAAGWTSASYPWPQEQPGSGALEPLLLPWGGMSSLRYAWDGSAFTRR